MANQSREEIPKEFFVENLTQRVLSLKKRLDYLVFILIVITAFAWYFMDEVPRDFILFSLDDINASLYHGIIALILLIMFAIVGSHMVEYIAKRKLIDKELHRESFFKDKRWRDEKHASNVEVANEKYMIISTAMAPSSFYEFLYTLDVSYKNLRAVAPFTLLLVFLVSHTIAYFHVVQIEIPYYIPEFLGIGWFAAYFFLYREFLFSVRRKKERLYKKFIKPSLWIFILYVVFILSLRIAEIVSHFHD